MTTPRFSIVLPRDDDATRASLLAQSFGDYELLRDASLDAARGDYVIRLDAGDVLYPEALATLDRFSRLPPDPVPAGKRMENSAILVCAILRRGWIGNGRQMIRCTDRTRGMIFTALPTLAFNVAPMQVAVARSLWPRGERADGALYARLVAAHGARYVPAVLGERDG